MKTIQEYFTELVAAGLAPKPEDFKEGQC